MAATEARDLLLGHYYSIVQSFEDDQNVREVNVSLRQSKEVFSRLKFNAVELQTKITFINTLYDEETLESVLTSTNGKIVRESTSQSEEKMLLKALKSEIETIKSRQLSLIRENCDFIADMDQCRRDIEELETEHQNFQQSISSLESISSPDARFSPLEVAQKLADQESTLQALKVSEESAASALLDADARFQRDQNTVLDIEAQTYELGLVFKEKERETATRDQKDKDLYLWCLEMSYLLESLYLIKLTTLLPIDFSKEALTLQFIDAAGNSFKISCSRALAPISIQYEIPCVLMDELNEKFRDGSITSVAHLLILIGSRIQK